MTSSSIPARHPIPASGGPAGVPAYAGPALVLSGDYDIFGTPAGIVRRRLRT